MRIAFLVSSICIAASAGAQISGPPAPFRPDVDYFASRVGLVSLKDGLPAGDQEVRIWSGFGLGGIQLVRAVRHDGRWTISRSDEVSRTTPHPLGRWIEDSVWTRRWTPAIADSFAALPATPRHPPDAPLVTDGWSVVIEFADGRTYHIAGAGNPQSYCSADDRRMLRVVAALELGVKSDCFVR